MLLDDEFLSSGSRNALSPSKREQVEKLLFINQFEDLWLMRTKFGDSLCSLIQNKYIEILKRDTKNKFKEFGYFVPRKQFENYFTKEQLKKIKVKTYRELREYYNDVLVPMLQRCSQKEDIISIKNYTFKQLEDKSYLIN